MATIAFPASDGVQLTGDLRFSGEAAEHGGVAVLCHPHPSFGGSMDSWMIPVLQSALVGDGWVALRFDFRGVGGSEGDHDDGVGELADVRGALDRVLEHADEGPVLSVGWSFGADVSLRQALDDDRVDGWVGVSLPVGDVQRHAGDLEDRLAAWTVPKLFVHGSRDELTAAERVEALVEAAAPPVRLRVIEGGDHLLTAYGDTLTHEILGFARQLRGVEDPPPEEG